MTKPWVSNWKEFLESERGALACYRKRRRRLVRILVDDIEPQSKRMSVGDRDSFQRAVSEQMASAGRGPFSGPIALSLDLMTTSKNAPQGHTIAKNILDLLGRSGVNGRHKHLLYKDDAQIQALSVSCRHGEDRPTITLMARPFAAMLDDLELADNTIRANEMDRGVWHSKEMEEEWVNTLRELIRNEASERQRLGDKLYKSYFKVVRRNAQQALLGWSSVDIPVLNLMYGFPRDIPASLPKEEWARLLNRSKLRIQVGDLPIAKGESKVFKQRVADEITAFKQRWSWIIDPLDIAVALEVVVRPNPVTPPTVLHDLDNIVRDYLIPHIVPSFGTVSDQRWTIDFDELRRIDSDLITWWGMNPTPPLGTKSGVTRYEAWRLPPTAREAGFVSVALVADMEANGGLIDQIDRHNRDWAGAQSRAKSRY